MERTVNKYQYVDIGLEIHIQLKTQSKLFSAGKMGSDLPPNSAVAPMDLGVPGQLPLLNREAVACATRIALGLGSDISSELHFDRKHYSYLDLPAGYQITQFFNSFAYNGKVHLPNGVSIAIKSMHLESDAAKLKYVDNNVLIDYNRCGSPLLEIVSNPDMHSADEAVEMVESLKRIVRFVNGSDCCMEKGQFRVDVNVSIREHKDAPLGMRTEIKNLNSCKNIRDAINYEIQEQQEFGRPTMARTVSFDVETGKTKFMRYKESYHDYCYTPEFNIPTIIMDQDFLNEQKKLIPSKLPHEKINEYKQITSLDNAIWIADHSNYVDIIDNLNQEDKSNAINIIINIINPYLDGKSLENFNIKNFIYTLKLLKQDKLSIALIKQKLIQYFFMNDDISSYIDKMNLCLINDKKQLLIWLQEAIAQNLKIWENYCNGETKLANVFKGVVMRLSGGKAHPIILEEVLRNYKNTQ